MYSPISKSTSFSNSIEAQDSIPLDNVVVTEQPIGQLGPVTIQVAKDKELTTGQYVQALGVVGVSTTCVLTTFSLYFVNPIYISGAVGTAICTIGTPVVWGLGKWIDACKNYSSTDGITK